MDHIKKIIDTDKSFEIDIHSREVTNPSETKKAIVQYDHNSERISFSILRMCEGHDLFECNKIEIHYVNTDNTTKMQSVGIYEVDDLMIDSDDENKLTFSWLVSQNATQKVGSLMFLVRFSCVEDDNTIKYAWNTALCSELVIQKGMWNSKSAVELYIDALAQMKENITPKRGTDYWTDEDIAEIKSYVDEAILGGEW
jgi:hypothetical protein